MHRRHRQAIPEGPLNTRPSEDVGPDGTRIEHVQGVSESSGSESLSSSCADTLIETGLLLLRGSGESAGLHRLVSLTPGERSDEVWCMFADADTDDVETSEPLSCTLPFREDWPSVTPIEIGEQAFPAPCDCLRFADLPRCHVNTTSPGDVWSKNSSETPGTPLLFALPPFAADHRLIVHA